MNQTRVSWLMLTLLAALAWPALVSYGQGGAAPRLAEASTSAGAPAAPPATPAARRAQADDHRIFLPAVSPGAQTGTLAFATAVDPVTVEPIDPATVFPAGTDLIYVVVHMQRYAGGSYRIVFTAPGDERLLGTDRSITSNDYRAASSYCFTVSTCSLSRSPFPPGVYTVELIVNDAVVAREQFSVQ